MKITEKLPLDYTTVMTDFFKQFPVYNYVWIHFYSRVVVSPRSVFIKWYKRVPLYCYLTQTRFTGLVRLHFHRLFKEIGDIHDLFFNCRNHFTCTK